MLARGLSAGSAKSHCTWFWQEAKREFFPALQTLNDAPGKGRTRASASASSQASRGLTWLMTATARFLWKIFYMAQGAGEADRASKYGVGRQGRPLTAVRNTLCVQVVWRSFPVASLILHDGSCHRLRVHRAFGNEILWVQQKWKNALIYENIPYNKKTSAAGVLSSCACFFSPFLAFNFKLKK